MIALLRRLREARDYRAAVAKLSVAERHALYAVNCEQAAFEADVRRTIRALP